MQYWKDISTNNESLVSSIPSDPNRLVLDNQFYWNTKSGQRPGKGMLQPRQ